MLRFWPFSRRSRREEDNKPADPPDIHPASKLPKCQPQTTAGISKAKPISQPKALNAEQLEYQRETEFAAMNIDYKLVKRVERQINRRIDPAPFKSEYQRTREQMRSYCLDFAFTEQEFLISLLVLADYEQYAKILAKQGGKANSLTIMEILVHREAERLVRIENGLPPQPEENERHLPDLPKMIAKRRESMIAQSKERQKRETAIRAIRSTRKMPSDQMPSEADIAAEIDRQAKKRQRITPPPQKGGLPDFGDYQK